MRFATAPSAAAKDVDLIQSYMTLNNNSPYDAIIVGAGMAGLSCASRLTQAGKSVKIIEKSDRPGGRIRTDEINGFRCDYGFQVLLTSYTQSRRLLDFDKLDLKRFEPGALLWNGDRLEVVADPIRQPRLALRSLASSMIPFGDKLRIAKLKAALTSRTDKALQDSPEQATLDHLRRIGFSDRTISNFFKPFFGGIFLEPQLGTSSRMFDFVFKSFATGFAALPADGMASVPLQLAKKLPEGCLQLGEGAKHVEAHEVVLENGDHLEAKEVILAVDMNSATDFSDSVARRGWNGTRCYYFSVDKSPLSRPMIALNSSGTGLIQSLCVPSDIHPSYAPEGKSLLCVSTLRLHSPSPDAIQRELVSWFGELEGLEFLRSYEIPRALPRQLPGDCPFESSDLQDPNGIWLCGDYRHSSSLQGAMRSGDRVAKAIIAKTLS